MREGDKPEEEEVEGVVEEMLPNAQFSVRTADGRLLRTMVARESRAFLVKISPGDRVALSVFQYDPGRGSILRKLKPLAGGRGSRE